MAKVETKEEYNARHKRWRQANPDKWRAAQDKYKKRIRAEQAIVRAEAKRLKAEAKALLPPRARTEEEKAINRERQRKAREANPAYFSEKSMRYNATKLQATPPWITKSDIKTMQLFYKEAERLTRETGIEHQVDHIYPLKGKTVCGLHVPCNLSVVTKITNNRKLNKHPEAFYGASLEGVFNASRSIIND